MILKRPQILEKKGVTNFVQCMQYKRINIQNYKEFL